MEEAEERAKNPGDETLLNIVCDQAAESGRAKLSGMTKVNPVLLREIQVVLNIGDIMIFRSTKEAAKWAAHHSPMEKDLERKFGWREWSQLIDWDKKNTPIDTVDIISSGTVLLCPAREN